MVMKAPLLFFLTTHLTNVHRSLEGELAVFKGNYGFMQF